MSRFRTRGIFIAIGIVGVLVWAHWRMGPFFYAAEPIRGRVVDAATGTPVAGAAVVAQWWLQPFGSGDPLTVLHGAETFTDEHGRYAFPAWGPKLRWPLTRFSTKDPIIMVYKPGYRLGGGDNRPAYVPVFVMEGARMKEYERPDGLIVHPPGGGYSLRRARRFSYWNGRDLQLEPLEREEYEVREIWSMRSFLDTAERARYPRTRQWLERRLDETRVRKGVATR